MIALLYIVSLLKASLCNPRKKSQRKLRRWEHVWMRGREILTKFWLENLMEGDNLAERYICYQNGYERNMLW
jgi:predicted ABC-class ATPase